eukprot:scaffold447_cov307-Pinguiococcus_pyrenoidosus.AAC.40
MRCWDCTRCASGEAPCRDGSTRLKRRKNSFSRCFRASAAASASSTPSGVSRRRPSRTSCMSRIASGTSGTGFDTLERVLSWRSSRTAAESKSCQQVPVPFSKPWQRSAHLLGPCSHAIPPEPLSVSMRLHQTFVAHAAIRPAQVSRRRPILLGRWSLATKLRMPLPCSPAPRRRESTPHKRRRSCTGRAGPSAAWRTPPPTAWDGAGGRWAVSPRPPR